jgi:hypothetical protein
VLADDVEEEELELPGSGAGVALPPRILNMTVPQVGHLPLMALRPFFIVSSTASAISFFALHLTQYPSGIREFHSWRFERLGGHADYLTGRLAAPSTGKTGAP